jgi:hypothetical protein
MLVSQQLNSAICLYCIKQKSLFIPPFKNFYQFLYIGWEAKWASKNANYGMMYSMKN